jgi:hypothetical protein
MVRLGLGSGFVHITWLIAYELELLIFFAVKMATPDPNTTQ